MTKFLLVSNFNDYENTFNGGFVRTCSVRLYVNMQTGKYKFISLGGAPVQNIVDCASTVTVKSQVVNGNAMFKVLI